MPTTHNDTVDVELRWAAIAQRDKIGKIQDCEKPHITSDRDVG